ncbi:hypothetical protein V6N12_016054 [Hibiscus sabdariffa]|uniref:Uncharacterized protein n=1 Tax=Hibiscus sabdariffa TaxID=183260 RepID=A0ABR2ALY8_9ROSI
MLQYERLLTLCYGCGLIGHLVAISSTVKLTLETKLQYGDWLRYLPPTTPLDSSWPQGHIYYHATNIPANPSTPISGLYFFYFSLRHLYIFLILLFWCFLIKLPTGKLDSETIEESVHSSDEASTANDANMAPNIPNPLDDFLNEEDFSTTLDVLSPTPLIVVKPNKETIVKESESPTIRANSIALESTISPTDPIQRGTKRRPPMVVASKAKKTRATNPPSNLKDGMSSNKNSPTVVDNQSHRWT